MSQACNSKVILAAPPIKYVLATLLVLSASPAFADRVERDANNQPYCRLSDGTTIILPPFVATTVGGRTTCRSLARVEGEHIKYFLPTGVEAEIAPLRRAAPRR
jgi:hypothetical protein